MVNASSFDVRCPSMSDVRCPMSDVGREKEAGEYLTTEGTEKANLIFLGALCALCERQSTRTKICNPVLYNRA